MAERKVPQTEEELLQSIIKLFNAVAPETPEEVDEALREMGHDPDEVAARMKAVAERALAESPMNWRQRAPEEVKGEKARLAGFQTALPQTRAEIIAAIRRVVDQLGAVQGKTVSAHYRNFDEVTDDDLKGLLTHLNYLASQLGQHPSDVQDEA